MPENESYPDSGWTKQSIKGDINADESFDLLDVITLQKWLLHEQIELADWKAGNLVNDEKLNIYDLIFMKKRLLQS